MCSSLMLFDLFLLDPSYWSNAPSSSQATVQSLAGSVTESGTILTHRGQKLPQTAVTQAGARQKRWDKNLPLLK